MNPERWKRIKQVYQSALDLEPDRRDAYVEEACSGDESLLKEVRSLLDQESEGLLDSPALGAAARALAEEQVSTPQPDLIGQTLQHYRIEEKIGEGGMGVVYRARDEHLKRDVAIKILPGEFSHDAERLARFEREAKLLASLNHPNIAAIYGFEAAEGKRFLVLELVEGETLGQRIAKDPLPVEEALEVCRQIAEGLEAAHEKGIIHRDLKPANVKITPEGRVKVLDFGLAKAFQPEAAAVDIARSPTISEVATRAGVILGTVAYMSPEQAKGKPVDKRADIWAFGSVLYECLTGKKAFHGETVTETVAAILKGEPDWRALPPSTPAKIRDLLQRCLSKDPGQRLRDIGDARIEIGESVSQPSELVAPRGEFSRRLLLALAVGGPIASILIGAGLMWYFRPAPSPAVVKSLIRIEPGQWLAGMGGQREFWRPSRTAMAVSNDGRFIVYSAIEGNPSPEAVPRLYLRRTDQMEAKTIEGTEGGINPFMSPDDRWVGFWAEGKLVKVSVDGGVPAILCDVPLPFGASWGPDNNIVLAPDSAVGLFSVSADGGKPEILTTPDKKREEVSHRLPHCLPGGKGVLFTITRGLFDSQPSVAFLDLKTRKWRALLEDAADARYVHTGHIIFLRRGTLMATAFELSRLEVTGRPAPVVANLMQAISSTDSARNTCAGQFGISGSGWLTYVMGGIVPDEENSLVWVDQRGSAQPIAAFKAPFQVPRLSPDGRRIAYASLGREWRLHVYDLSRGTESPLTGDGKVWPHTWTTDGRRLVFSWRESGPGNLHWQPADGSSPMERLTTSEYRQCPASFTPDGATLAFVEGHPDTGFDILLLDMKSRRVTPFLNSRSFEGYPAFSPDGRWLAYTSDESGREEIYVRPFPNPGGKWKLSLEGGREPLWARNGKQLFYRWRDQVWAVDFPTDAGFTWGKPRRLFDVPGYRMSSPIAGWDISLDDQRFLIVQLDQREPEPITEMILVQNWFEELKRLVPPGK